MALHDLVELYLHVVKGMEQISNYTMQVAVSKYFTVIW